MALTKVTSTVIKDATITDADIGSTLTSAISGSTTALSSSVATRFDSRETDMTLATASIALNESNMTLATASIAAITASLGQPVNTDSNVTFGVITSGDINSSGTITATEIHTTFVSSSITVSSGSNIFGDDTSDIHHFTGSLRVTGSNFIISSSGNVGIATADPTTRLQIAGSSNEEDVILLEDNSGNDVGALRIHSNAFIMKGKHSSSPVQIQTHDGNEDIEVDPDGFIKFETAGGERMRITSGGNVEIKTTTAASTNSQSLPGYLQFSGFGWDTNSGSDPIGARITMGGSYSGVISGGVIPHLAFSIQNSGDAGSTSETMDEHMRIRGDGKVGIGTTTMDAFLNINSGADNSGLHVESTDGGANLSLADNAGSTVLQGLGGALVVEVNGSAGTAGSSATEKFRIPSVGGIAVTGDFHDSATSDESNYQISFGGDSTTAPRWGFRVSTSANDEDLHLDRNLSGTPATCMTWDKANGNVGIGETAPDEKLHVKGGAGVTIEVESTAGNDARFMLKTSSTQYTIGANEGGRGNDTLSIDDDQANAERLRIKSDGEIDGNFNDTSDRAQKENIKDLTNTLEGVKALNPSTFNWIKEKAKGDKTKIGFIAQDVEAQFPELVDGKEGEKSISTIGLVSVLTKAVQELSEKIEHIEKTCKCMKEE